VAANPANFTVNILTIPRKSKANLNSPEKCLSATSTKEAPWYIVPADDKDNARLIVSEIILDLMEGLKMSYPHPSEDRRRELLAIRGQLEE
jgi:hypothetical protein